MNKDINMSNFSKFLKKLDVNYIILLLAGLYFLFMMVHNLMNSPLWGDEWVEWDFSQKAILDGSMYQYIIITFQPPLYNFVMHFWLKISDSIMWFRLFNIPLGIVSGGFLVLSVKRLYNVKMAAFSLLILGSAYQWIYYIQECAEYALMLTFLFAALYFFICVWEKETTINLICFSLMCVGAVYSQYGAVFMIVPLAVSILFRNIRYKNKKAIVTNLVVYSFCAICFALPLFVKFASVQIANQQDGTERVKLSLRLFSDVLYVPGQILGYFFNMNGQNYWNFYWKLVGVLICCLMIYLIIIHTTPSVIKVLMSCSFVTYLMHYLLTQMHVYAMLHPNQCAGFSSRYSLFSLPIYFFLIPSVLQELYQQGEKWKLRNVSMLIAGMLASIMVVSATSVWTNWIKAYDRQYSEIWIEHEGWKADTYLLGCSDYSFNYYILKNSDVADIVPGESRHSVWDVDVENLPEKFWIWGSGWGVEKYDEIIENARVQGYQIEVYDDHRYGGYLAYLQK